jgi:hypothetical protein
MGEYASMSLRAFAAAVCLILPIAAPASAAPLQPSEKWHVFFDEAQCLAQRNYGSKERPIYLILKQPALGDVLQVAVAKATGISEPTEFDGSFSFDNQAPQKASFLIFRPKGQSLAVHSTNLPLAKMSPARTAKTLKLAVKTKRLHSRTWMSCSGLWEPAPPTSRSIGTSTNPVPIRKSPNMRRAIFARYSPVTIILPRLLCSGRPDA